jgi:AraC-like DNA-binding protein
MADSPILASPLLERRVALDDATFYFGRYRGFAATPHVHDTAQLLIPLAGRMGLTVGDRPRLLVPESAAWIPPGVAHAVAPLAGQLDFVAIEVDVARHAGPLPAAPAVIHGPGPWLLGQALARELDEPAGPLPEVLVGCLGSLLAYFTRAVPPASLAAEPPPGVLQAVAVILERYAQDLRVPDLAAAVMMSPRHFERSFKRAIGQSPKRFMIGVRLGAAETLLRDRDLPIGQIALEVGFATPSHFAAAFLAHAGLTPAAYRAAARVSGTRDGP